MKKRITIALLGVGLLAGGTYGAYEYFMGAKCSPRGNCNACKNCNYCKNCSQRGGSCSVCR